jgi:membrane protein DedA with SNARE-associated domain
MAIESAAIPLPSELIMPLAGWMLVRDGGLSEPWLLLAAFCGAVGNVIGSLAAYAIGAWGGRPALRRYGRYVLITPHEIQRAEIWFDRYGAWAVFISRMLPVVRTFISLPAWVARMPIVPFVILTFIGSFPWSLGLAWGGFILADRWEEMRDWMRPADIPIVVTIVVVAAWYLYRRVRAVHFSSEGAGSGRPGDATERDPLSGR